MHYGFGTLTGAAYGVLAELVPGGHPGAGAPFGTALWLGADEIAVPAFGLSGSALGEPAVGAREGARRPPGLRLATEGVRRLVRRAL